MPPTLTPILIYDFSCRTVRLQLVSGLDFDLRPRPTHFHTAELAASLPAMAHHGGRSNGGLEFFLSQAPRATTGIY